MISYDLTWGAQVDAAVNKANKILAIVYRTIEPINQEAFSILYNLTQPSYNNRYYHNSFTYKASHLWNQLPSYIKRSTELSEYRKHLRSFNLTILRASCKCNFCISYGFTISVFFSLKVLNFFLPFLVFN